MDTLNKTEMIQINEKALKDFKEKTKELDSFLTERISAFHGVKEMIQARHAYIFYRQMLWDAQAIINKGIERVEPIEPSLTKNGNEKI